MAKTIRRLRNQTAGLAEYIRAQRKYKAAREALQDNQDPFMEAALAMALRNSVSDLEIAKKRANEILAELDAERPLSAYPQDQDQEK